MYHDNTMLFFEVPYKCHWYHGVTIIAPWYHHGMFCRETTLNKTAVLSVGVCVCLTAVSPLDAGLTEPEWAGLTGGSAPGDWGGGDLGLRGETSLLVAEGDEGLLSKEMERELIKENRIINLSKAFMMAISTTTNINVISARNAKRAGFTWQWVQPTSHSNSNMYNIKEM